MLSPDPSPLVVGLTPGAGLLELHSSWLTGRDPRGEPAGEKWPVKEQLRTVEKIPASTRPPYSAVRFRGSLRSPVCRMRCHQIQGVIEWIRNVPSQGKNRGRGSVNSVAHSRIREVRRRWLLLARRRPWEVRLSGRSFQPASRKFLKHRGVSMRAIAWKRFADRISNAGITRHLTALMIVTGLLFIWVGLCAI